MRIKWEDSRTYKTYHYRGHTIEKIKEGWVTTVPGDEYIYHSAEMALNAVDHMIGGHGRNKDENIFRRSLGIKIVGRKDGADDACSMEGQ